MRQHSKQQRLSARCHARGTNLNNACAVPREMKCEHAMPLVLLDQSAIENIPTLWNPPSHSNPKLPCNSVNILPKQTRLVFFLPTPFIYTQNIYCKIAMACMS